MPKFTARGAIELVHETGLDLPFILVSGTIGEEAAVDAMRAGAHDYVLKDRLARLAPALEREIRDHEVRKARRGSDEALRREQARFRALIEKSHDGITLSGRDATIHYASPAAKRLLGIGADGATIKAMDLWDSADAERLQVARALAGRAPRARARRERHVELRIRRPRRERPRAGSS